MPITANHPPARDMVLTFGVNKGQPLSLVSEDYLTWMAKVTGGITMPDANWSELAAQELYRRHHGLEIVSNAVGMPADNISDIDAVEEGNRNSETGLPPQVREWMPKNVIDGIMKSPRLIKLFLTRLRQDLTFSEWVFDLAIEARRDGEQLAAIVTPSPKRFRYLGCEFIYGDDNRLIGVLTKVSENGPIPE